MCDLSNKLILQPWTEDLLKQYQKYTQTLPDYVGDHAGPLRDFYPNPKDQLQFDDILNSDDVSLVFHKFFFLYFILLFQHYLPFDAKISIYFFDRIFLER